MIKKELRKIYIDKRKKCSIQEYNENSLLICNKISEYFINKNIKKVHLYLPILEKGEVNLWYLILLLLEKNITVIIPKIKNKHQLQHHYYNDQTYLIRNKFGILEPVNNVYNFGFNFDFVIIPLLIYDKKGYRVGYGKGYYDKFLAKCKKSTIKIGVSFENPINSILDINNNDIKLNYCITPTKIHPFA